MSHAENKAIARKCFNALNKQFEVPNPRDDSVIDEVMSAKWASEIKSWFPGLNQLWLDHHIEVTDMVAEGNMVWCRLATSATHLGEWEGIPANGKHWTNTGIWYLTIVDHKIVDIEWLFDGLPIVKQLGGTILPSGSYRSSGLLLESQAACCSPASKQYSSNKCLTSFRF